MSFVSPRPSVFHEVNTHKCVVIPHNPQELDVAGHKFAAASRHVQVKSSSCLFSLGVKVSGYPK